MNIHFVWIWILMTFKPEWIPLGELLSKRHTSSHYGFTSGICICHCQLVLKCIPATHSLVGSFNFQPRRTNSIHYAEQHSTVTALRKSQHVSKLNRNVQVWIKRRHTRVEADQMKINKGQPHREEERCSILDPTIVNSTLEECLVLCSMCRFRLWRMLAFLISSRIFRLGRFKTDWNDPMAAMIRAVQIPLMLKRAASILLSYLLLHRK